MTRIERYVAWVLAHGKTIWIIAVLLAIPATWRTATLYAHLKSDVQELLPRESPSVKAVDEVRARMPGLQFLGVVLDTGSAENIDAGNKFLDDLAARVRKYPPDLVNSVRLGTEEERQFLEKHAALYMDLDDLKTIRKRIEERRDYEAMKATGNLLDEDQAEPPPLNFDDIQKKYDERTPKGGNADGSRYSSKKLHLSLMLIEVGSYATGDEKARELYKRVQDEVAAMGGPASYAPGMRLGYSGDVAISTEELSALLTDLSISSVVVFILVGAVIVLYYRWWRSIVMLIAPLLIATVYSFALASLPPLSITELNSNTAFLGSIIVGNGINFGIVLLARYVEERRKKKSVQESLVLGIDGAKIGTLSAALAAGASYVSLVITQFRGFRQFGCIGGIGMVLSWCAAFFLMPPLVAWLDSSEKTAPKPIEEKSRFMGSVANAVTRVPALFVAIGAVLTIGAAGLARTFDMSHLEYDFSKLRRADTWTNGEGYWGRKMDELLGTYLTPVVLLADDHEQARVIEDHVREAIAKPPMNEMVASVRTIDDVLPSQQKEKLEEADEISEDLTPKIRSLIAEDKRPTVERIVDHLDDKEITVDDLPRSFLTAMRERDGSVGKTVLVYPRPSHALWEGPSLVAFVKDLRALAASGPGRPARVAGSLALSADILQSIQHDGPIACAVAFFGVMVIVLLLFRGRSTAFYVIGSLVVGVLWLLAGAMLFKVKINFANFIAFPITFGIGVDYAVNVVSRYVEDGEKDVALAVRSTGSAVALCSCTTIIGYSSLLMAENRALFLFGLLAVMGEIACLSAGVVFMPALLQLMQKRRAAKPAT